MSDPTNTPGPIEPQPEPPTQPGYPGYGAPPAAAPDTRPKTLGLTALILAVLGLIIAAGGFIPMPWIAIVLTAVGGLLLLAALILGIVALASKRQGGKGLGIAAIVVSVVGGVIWAFALIAAFLWFGLAAFNAEVSADPTPVVSATVDPGATDGADDATGGEGPTAEQQQAYLDEVKPAVLAIMQTIEPTITAEQLDAIYSDEDLVASGEQLASIPADQREAQREAFITASVQTSGGVLTEETAGQLFDVLINAADEHLVN